MLHLSQKFPLPISVVVHADMAQVRALLGIFNAFALSFYARGVRRVFGENTALWYILFQASQFHVIYYASRTLPNMFAFGISTLFSTRLHLLSLKIARRHTRIAVPSS